MTRIGIGIAITNGLTSTTPAPVNTTAPSVPATIVVGTAITINAGVWAGSPTSYNYKTYRGATLIDEQTTSATSISYTPVQADAGNTSNIKCVVVATNGGGSTSADSNTVAQVLDALASAFITATGITDATVISATNAYIIARKAVSATASIAAYPFVGGTAATHGRNLYNAADSDAARRITWGGTLTHGANGVQGNGTNGNGNPYISTSEFTGDFTIVFYSRTNNNGGYADYGGINASTQGISCVSRFSDNNCYAAFNSGSSSAGAIFTRTDGCILIKRSGTSVTIKRNNTTIYTGTHALATSNVGLRLFARNFNGALDNYSNRQYTHWEVMAFATTTQQDTDLYNAVVAKETALARNV